MSRYILAPIRSGSKWIFRAHRNPRFLLVWLSRSSQYDWTRATARIPVLLFSRSYLFQIFADEFTAIDLKFRQIKEARGLEDGQNVFRVKETRNDACTEALQTAQ